MGFVDITKERITDGIIYTDQPGVLHVGAYTWNLPGVGDGEYISITDTYGIETYIRVCVIEPMDF